MGVARAARCTATDGVIHCLEQKAVSLQCAEMQVASTFRLFQLNVGLTDAIRALFPYISILLQKAGDRF